MSGPGLVALAVDWNGTIVDDVQRAWDATTSAVMAVGHPQAAPSTLERFREAFTLPMARFFAELGVPEPELDRCVRRWNSAMTESPAPLAPGARTLLRAARAAGVPVIVVSGAHERVIRHDSATLGVASLLSTVHGSTHPKREVLRRYAARGPVAFVGDTRYDVAEGEAAGAFTIAVDFGYGHAAELAAADRVVSDLAALVPLVTGER